MRAIIKTVVLLLTFLSSQHAAAQEGELDKHLTNTWQERMPKSNGNRLNELNELKDLKDYILSPEDIELGPLAQIMEREISISPDQQFVSPKAARDRYYQSEAREWRERSEGGDITNSDEVAQLTCDEAITSLFVFVCGGNKGCEVESEYEKRCLLPKELSQYRLNKCLSTEQTYVSSCFATQGLEFGLDVGHYSPYERSIGLIRSDDNSDDENLLASSAIVKTHPDTFSEEEEHTAVTAAHVVDELEKAYGFSYVTKFPLMQRKFKEERESKKIDNYLVVGQLEPVGDDHDKLITPLLAARPKLFDRTFFHSLNSISYTRHRMAEKFDLSRNLKYRYELIDRSATCTIAEIDSRRLEHTCQSTKGGSGGALIQLHKGEPVIVGINEGARTSGVVSHNVGTNLGQYIDRGEIRFLSRED